MLTLGVSGFVGDLARSGEHVRWMDETLRVGDRLSVTVLDTDRIDSPAWRHQEDPALVERAERRQYLRLKRRYERGRQPTTRRTRRRRGR